MRRSVLYAVFAGTGAAALGLQVTWQRVLTLHAGVDLSSVTTVVAAFMVGLGLGNLGGGWLADRLTTRACARVYAACNVVIAGYALASLWLLNDVYAGLLRLVDHPVASFGLHTLAVAVPTVLMGASLPLLARVAVHSSAEIAPVVGRLYAANTLGAAAGAMAASWYVMGTFGLTGTVRLAALINVLAAAALAGWSPHAGATAPEVTAPAPVPGGQSAGRWVLLYGLTGAVALGLELVFFRVVDTLMRSNAHSFGHVLGLYLLLFGAGAAAGAGPAARTARPDRRFLVLQLAVAVSALLGLALLVDPPALFGIRKAVQGYFATDGFAAGDYRLAGRREVVFFAFAHLLGPLVVMGAPVFLMGAAFPCVQALVARDMAHLGRQTGRLLFANLIGNFVGSVVTGFLLMDALGTAGTALALALVLGVPTLVGLVRTFERPAERMRAGLVGGVALVAALGLAPSQQLLWSRLLGAPTTRVWVEEDHACATQVRRDEEQMALFVNGASQNGYPYDDFHVLIGLTPSLLHPAPVHGLSIGFGIGATPFAMAQDGRLERVENVELCGGEHALVRRLAEQGSPESRYVLENPRLRLHVGDGRRFLEVARERWDVITVDALRTTSQASGNLYSVEFYELVRERLAPGGLFAQWLPTDRTLQTVRAVFPWVMTFDVKHYNASTFLVAGAAPFSFDRVAVLDRLETATRGQALSPEALARLRGYYAQVEPSWRQQRQTQWAREERLNRDLFPRDEFFLNNAP